MNLGQRDTVGQQRITAGRSIEDFASQKFKDAKAQSSGRPLPDMSLKGLFFSEELHNAVCESATTGKLYDL
jgi:hypothetical protein